MEHYVLVDKIAVFEPDFMTWARWFERFDRTVRLTVLGDATISTVFLGIDHSFFAGSLPLLFETMVFGGPLDGAQERCSTWEEAEVMHKNMLLRH